MRDLDSIMKRLQSQRARTPEEILEWEWKHEVIPKLKEIGLPDRFHEKITNWGQPKQEKAFNICKSRITGTGAILALVGSRGAGKTTIAAQLIIERAMAFYEQPTGWPVPYTKLTDLVNRFKVIYADFGGIDTESVTWRRDTFCKYPLRIIDELHECDDQKLKNRILTDIIDRCYSGLVDTVIISNQKVDDFQATTSDSILSRISEHGAIIPCEWPSHRTPRK